MDLAFAVKQVCEKYLLDEKDVFWDRHRFEYAILYDSSTWYVADAKSVWSWRKIVESSACRVFK